MLISVDGEEAVPVNAGAQSETRRSICIQLRCWKMENIP